MSNDHNVAVLELSKALIGCLGAILAACITGIFAVVAVIKPPPSRQISECFTRSPACWLRLKTQSSKLCGWRSGWLALCF